MTSANDRSGAPMSDLFESIEFKFSNSGLGSNRWYLLCAAALAGSNDPQLCDQLYLYLIAKPEFSQSCQRQELIRRVREALVKCVSIVGVCKPLEAIIAINKQEKQEDKDHSTTREGWQCDEANLERGMGWMRKIYTSNTETTMDFFNDHKDFEWISRHITYGLYLSDRQVLDDFDTEIVVLSGIMIQNLPLETHWHIRGARRLGISAKDVQVLWDSVQSIAHHLGVNLGKVPSVREVESDV
ncbi:hypothetical protein FOMA001_g18298 [Fusarium oxysporum f. sp. matthiolae]|nr:hypothetical protein FOMA001_g18298 [Fusarium oxysporum f. sp. matthiolae]